MNNTEFFNAYVENVLADVIELTKLRLMMKTQIDILEATVKKQAERIKELEASMIADSPVPAEEPKESF